MLAIPKTAGPLCCCRTVGVLRIACGHISSKISVVGRICIQRRKGAGRGGCSNRACGITRPVGHVRANDAGPPPETAARHGWQWRPRIASLGARYRRRLSNACSRAAHLSRQWRPRSAWLGARSRRRLSNACSRAARLSWQWRPRIAWFSARSRRWLSFACSRAACHGRQWWPRIASGV